MDNPGYISKERILEIREERRQRILNQGLSDAESFSDSAEDDEIAPDVERQLFVSPVIKMMSGSITDQSLSSSLHQFWELHLRHTFSSKTEAYSVHTADFPPDDLIGGNIHALIVTRGLEVAMGKYKRKYKIIEPFFAAIKDIRYGMTERRWEQGRRDLLSCLRKAKNEDRCIDVDGRGDYKRNNGEEVVVEEEEEVDEEELYKMTNIRDETDFFICGIVVLGPYVKFYRLDRSTMELTPWDEDAKMYHIRDDATAMNAMLNTAKQMFKSIEV
ncbi:hypothetical protein FQN57_001653 [Myotisia sp. PD_48]|nr:hypothetical protein FQN57_001653 [Myotisia sp. PD_48]